MTGELLQLVDEQGRPAGTAARSECHGDPRLIQAVVHLHLLDGEGRLYLQRRARSKDLFPGRWDSAVGGHMAPGETPWQAIRREAREELGIDLDETSPDSVAAAPEHLSPYLYRDDTETEFVFPFRMVLGGVPRPSPEEVEEGAFLALEEIRRRLAGQPEEFTPHFRSSFRRFFGGG